MAEKIFFQDTQVKITDTLFSVGNATYSIKNISSVRSAKLSASSMQIIGAVLVVTSFIYSALLLSLQEQITAFLIIAFLTGIFILAIFRDTYAVKISSNSGEAEALKSTNQQYVQQVAQSLIEAISYKNNN